MMQSSTLPTADVSVRRSLWIPSLFVGAMLVVVGVNATLIYYAEHTFSGLDTEKYYQAGLDYNKSLKDAAASAALGWSAKPTIEPDGTQRQVRIAISNKDGAPVDGLTVSVHLVRPASTAFDRFLRLKPVGPGTYASELDLPALGAWDLRIEATGGAAPFQTTQRVLLK